MRDQEAVLRLQAKVAAVAMVVLTYVTYSGVISEFVFLPLLGLAAFVAWRGLSGFWRAFAGGLSGGVVAGLLILGPGYRLAMRAVALMDPVHPEEFSWGGTLFIVVGVGAIMGGTTGLSFHLARRAFGIESALAAGLLLAMTQMIVLAFFSGDLSDELFQLGISVWINIPLFTAVTVGYGVAAMAVADKTEHWMVMRRGTESVKVPA